MTDSENLTRLNNKKAAAKKLLANERKFKKFMARLQRKLSRCPQIGKQLSEIPVFIELVYDYASGIYKDIPLGSIIGILAALIYFVSPFDAIPDIIPFAGMLDDVGVLTVAVAMMHDDITEYLAWQETKE